MLSLSQIEADLTGAMKSHNQLVVETLRGLKTRIQGELTKAGSDGKELSEAQIVALIRSEVKKRKDAAEAFIKGARAELAKKEQDESLILEKYLPAQMPMEQLEAIIDKAIGEMSATAADFGKVMGKLKAEVGDKADGGSLAKLLKEKLK